MHYQEILTNVGKIARGCGRNPADISLVVVSKGHGWDEMRGAYAAGCRLFAENRLPEAERKRQLAPQDIRWHFIGTLQKNKVRKSIGQFALIHSVDSFELAQKISHCSLEAGVKTEALLQVNVGGEASKQGMTPEGCMHAYEKIVNLPGIFIQGLMTMAPFTEDEREIRQCFSGLRELGGKLRLSQLSMGMSHDFRIAIEEGATLLRIGSAIFG